MQESKHRWYQTTLTNLEQMSKHLGTILTVTYIFEWYFIMDYFELNDDIDIQPVQNSVLCVYYNKEILLLISNGVKLLALLLCFLQLL